MDQAENDQRRQIKGLVLPLPDDILDDVLRRLSPRDLSVLRCVAKPWRSAVDGLLLPRSVGGIFICFNNLDSLEYLARPTTTGTPVSGKLDFMATTTTIAEPSSALLKDHCNGLLLFHHCVVNPATRRCAPLPPRPPELTWRNNKNFYHDEYLVFDPVVSPHHEVFAIPKILYRPGQEHVHYQSSELADPAIENSEWPPSPWNLFVFSSRTGRWEERSFMREGPAGGSGTVASKRWSSESHSEGHYAAYWQGELYNIFVGE
nr:unnamed protein product [Digitaria exilis]